MSSFSKLTPEKVWSGTGEPNWLSVNGGTVKGNVRVEGGETVMGSVAVSGNLTVDGTLTAGSLIVPTPNVQIATAFTYNASATSGTITSDPLVITAVTGYFNFTAGKIYNVSMIIRVDLNSITFSDTVANGVVGGFVNVFAYCGNANTAFSEVDYFLPNGVTAESFHIALNGSVTATDTGVLPLKVQLQTAGGLLSATVVGVNLGAYTNLPIVVQQMN